MFGYSYFYIFFFSFTIHNFVRYVNVFNTRTTTAKIIFIPRNKSKSKMEWKSKFYNNLCLCCLFKTRWIKCFLSFLQKDKQEKENFHRTWHICMFTGNHCMNGFIIYCNCIIVNFAFIYFHFLNFLLQKKPFSDLLIRFSVYHFIFLLKEKWKYCGIIQS